MYWITKEKKKDLKRNIMSIRFTDEEHRLVCDAAWKNRISASGMIRDFVFNGLMEKNEENEKNEKNEQDENKSRTVVKERICPPKTVLGKKCGGQHQKGV